MTKFISAFGDRMLSLAVRKEEAGACVPVVNKPCGGTWETGNGYCNNAGNYFYQVCDKNYTCGGLCVDMTITCYYVRQPGIVC